MSRLSFLLPALVSLALAAPVVASADQPAPPATQPDESVLGTVEVNGSAGGLPPLPKLAVVPILVTAQSDSVVNLVTRHDLES